MHTKIVKIKAWVFVPGILEGSTMNEMQKYGSNRSQYF